MKPALYYVVFVVRRLTGLQSTQTMTVWNLVTWIVQTYQSSDYEKFMAARGVIPVMFYDKRNCVCYRSASDGRIQG